jgi:hypothetical protein
LECPQTPGGMHPHPLASAAKAAPGFARNSSPRLVGILGMPSHAGRAPSVVPTNPSSHGSSGQVHRILPWCRP